MRRIAPFVIATALAMAAPLAGAQVSHQVWIDVDVDVATGCFVANAAGSADGVDLVLSAEVSGAPPTVQALTLQRCESGVFTSPESLGGGYPVGLDNGTGGADVVELAMARALAPDIAGNDWRLVFASSSARGADLIGPVLAPGLGVVNTAPAPVPSPTVVPTLSSWGLLALCVLFALGLLWMARRQRGLLSVLLMAGGLMVLGIAWAANYLLDGQVGDWDVAALSGDPQGDTTGVDEAVDLVAAFAARESTNVYFRNDVLDSENNPPLVADQAFDLDENSPAGTAVGTVVASDADAGDTLGFAITAGNTGGAFAIDAGTGAITVATAAAIDFEANPSFALEVTVSDDATVVASTSATITVTINDLNEAPTLADAGFDVVEDSPDGTVVGSVVASDPDTSAPNNTLGFAITAGNTGGAFAIDAAGEISVAATGAITEANSPFSLTVEVSDGPGLTATATVTITVIGINHAPSFVAGAPVVVDEDAGPQLLPGWASAISDGDGGTQVLTFTIGNDNPALFAAGPDLDEASGDLSFTPADDANGVANLSIVLSDDGGTALGGQDSSAPQLVTVTVNAVNDAPVAVADGYATNEDVPLVVAAPGVLGNDSDVENDPLTAVLVTDVANGSLVLAADGGFSYTPNPDFNGSDSFSYRANDGALDSAVVTVTLDVTSIEDLPVAVDDAATVTEDDPATTIAVQANDIDPDSPINVIDSVTQPANGTVVITNAGVDLSYQPDPDYCNDGSPTDDFSYTLMPGGSTATVAVTVTCVNDLPQIDLDADDSAGTGGADYAAVFSEGDPALAISDVDASLVDPDTANLASLTATLTNLLDVGEETLSADTTGTSIVAAFVPATGVLTLTGPDSVANFEAVLRTIAYRNTSNAPDETTQIIQLVANDGLGDGNVATATISVIASDTAPTAVDDAATVAEDAGASAIDVLANDTDPDGGPISITANSDPANGTVVITGGGTGLSYTPDAEFCNDGTPTDDFTYTLSPGGDVATVAVTVTCVDDDPVAVADAAIVLEDSGANAIDVLANDTDVDGGAISITAVSDPANGTVVIIGGGTGVSYTPDANTCNDGTPTDDFTYTLSPGGSSTTVAVTVTCVDDPPVAVADTGTVLEDAGATAIDVLTNDTDIDGGTKTVQSVTQPTNGTVVITGGGSGLTYEPDPNYCNDGTPTDDFTYTLNGGSSATVAVTVTCVNDPPVAGADAWDTIGNTQLVVDLAAPGNPHVLDTTAGAADGVRDNDSDPVEGDNTAVTAIVGCADLTAPFVCPTVNGGTVSMNADGTFTYTPAAGDTAASDSFQYTLSDDGTPAPASANGTVTINRFERVWYVDNSAAGGGNGTSGSPFNALTSLNGVGGAGDSDSPNDWIFVHFGNGTSTGQAAGLVLENGQRLLGEHAGLSIPVNLNGNGSPTVLHAGTPGSRPLIGDTAAGGPEGVSAIDVIPAEVAGLSLSGNVNAVEWTTTAAFAGTGTFSIRDNVVTGAGAIGVDINLAGTGATRLAFHDNTLTATGTALNIQETGTGALTITAFGDNVVSGNAGGSGIVVNNAVFDSVPGLPIDQVAGGTTLIGQSGNGTGTSGVLLTNVVGDLTFTELDIFNDNGTGLQVTSTGVLNAAAGTGFRLLLPAGVATIDSNGGPAVDVNNASVTLPLGFLESTNSITTGVSLVNAFGGVGQTTLSATSGAISDPVAASGTAVNISGGTGHITLGIPITNSSGNAIVVSGRSADTVAFTGAIAETGSGISLTGNSGTALVSFRGGLTASTGASAAFTATGGGNVEVCDENPCTAATGALINTLTTTTGIALNVANTTITANDLEFRSISANGASSGIVLNTTGALGGLVVKGTGAANSGGTIQNTTSHGVSLVSTTQPMFTSTRILSTGGSGINGTAVSGFTFVNGTISNSGNAVGESNIAFNGNGTLLGNNFSGVLTVTGSTFTNAFDHGLHVQGDQGSISSAVIQNNTFTSTTSTATSQGTAIQLVGTGNAATVHSLLQATITGNTISNFPGGGGIQVNYGNANATGPAGFAGTPGSGTNIVTITGNFARGASPANRMNTHAIIAVVSGGNGSQRSGGNFVVQNNGTVGNPLGDNTGITIGIGINGFATVTANIDNNVMVSNNALGSGGISGGNGVVIGCAAGSCETPDATVTSNNNTISQTDGNGILLVGRGTTGLAKLGIRGNSVAAPLGGTRPGIRVDAGNNSANSDDAVCMDMSGNTTGGSGGHEGIGLRKQGTVATTHDFGVEGMAATATPGVENYVGNTGQNPGSANGSFGISGVLLISASSGFSNCSTAP